VIVIGAIATLLLNVAIPSVLKYLILIVTSYAASNLIVSLYRRAAMKINMRRDNSMRNKKNYINLNLR
jgi:hypothetical protein